MDMEWNGMGVHSFISFEDLYLLFSFLFGVLLLRIEIETEKLELFGKGKERKRKERKGRFVRSK